MRSARFGEPQEVLVMNSPDRESPGLIRRVTQLLVGLVGFGVSLALMVRAQLGLGPWDVLHQGVAERTGVEIGWIVIAVSVLVLVLWIPLHQRPGFGTVANAILVGLSVNAALAVLPTPRTLAPRIFLLVVGIVANGAATGLYIGAGLGPGPRDGLMTGLAQRGYSIRIVRTGIELAVLALGWGLGGTVGLGTVAYALGIGPLAHYFIPRLTVASDGRARERVGSRRARGRGCVAGSRLAMGRVRAPHDTSVGNCASGKSKGEAWEQCCSA